MNYSGRLVLCRRPDVVPRDFFGEFYFTDLQPEPTPPCMSLTFEISILSEYVCRQEELGQPLRSCDLPLARRVGEASKRAP